MKRRWTALLTALVLVLALLPAPARAAQAEVDSSAGSRLTGADREVYQYLKTEIGKVARGDRTSTDFRIPSLDALSWPLRELGIEGDRQSDILAGLGQKFSENLHIERIYTCLILDLPYDLFWRGDRYYTAQSFARQGDRVSVQDLVISIEVSRSYRGSSGTAVDPAKIAAANQVVKRAEAIVDKYKDLSDAEKLNAYREEICGLVSYDSTVARNGQDYGDPWQMIYVFDGDPNTNVVCEGYAKAFKYLCDLSQFEGNVVCRLATGLMNGGGHMWNVLQMEDGKHYLADVTNCDEGAVGAEDKLFLVGASGSGPSWTVSGDRWRASYTYDRELEGLHTDGWLSLSAEDYTPPEPGAAITITVAPPETEPPAPQPSGAFTDVEPDAYYAEAVTWAVESDITNGTTPTTFSPGDTCTHGQILTFLWRAAGKPGEASLQPDEAYYAPALRWAEELGMLEGAERFDPAADCSRRDAVRYIWYAFHRPEAQPSSFSDVPAGADWAGAVSWAVEQGVTKGTSASTFEPDNLCSRGEIVTFLHRAYVEA